MKKSLVFMIAVLLVGALMVSCNSDVSEGTNVGDKLVEVTISGGSTAKGISAVGSMENADAYYWYYKAGKNDSSVYRTGETVAVTSGALGAGGWKPVKTNGNNEAVVGLKNANLGFFSTGDWLFSFVAYKKAATFNGDTATNGNDTLVPVYYQYNLSVEVSSNTIASSTDQKVYITVTPNVGKAQGDAEFVFPEAGLTWKYVNDTSADAQYTLAALNNKKAYMYVYYKDNSETNDTEHLLARSDDATISTADSGASATFNGFKGVDTNSAFTKDPVTIKSTYSGKNYTLYFRVVLSSNDEEIGSTNTQSVTAYTGGKITISSTGTASVYDNEVQYQVEIKEVDAVITSSANGVTTSAATVVAAAVPTTEPTVLNSSTETYSVAQVITSSNISSSEKSAEKKSSVSIPEGALQSTTMTLTEKTGSGTDETKTVTVVETSYKVEDTKDTSATISPPSNFTVTSGNTVVSKLSYTMIATKTTTTTKTVGGTETEKTSNAESYSVTNFATENNNTTTYYVITDYLDTDLEDVVVKYDGTGDDVVFSKTGTPDPAHVDNTSSENYTGYDPNTGLLIFKTSHFSDFYVTAKQTVVAENKTQNKKYYSFARAISRAEDGDLIELVTSTSVGSGYTTSNPLILSAKNVTLDLKTLTLTVENNFSFVIAGDGDTVKNGSIISGANSAKKTNKNSYILVVNDCDSVSLNGLTMQGGLSVGGSQRDWGTVSNPKIAGVPGADKATNVVIEDCNITSGDYYAVCSQMGSDATIKSGTYVSNQTAVNNGVGQLSPAVIYGRFVDEDGPEGYITVEGGKFTGTIGTANQDWIVLKGGYYTEQPAAVLVAEGYEAVADTSEAGYQYSVKSIVATLNGTPYNSFDDVIAALSGLTDATIVLQKDIHIEFSTKYYYEIVSGQKLKIDLNGFIVRIMATNSQTTAFLHVCDGGELVLEDSSATDNGIGLGKMVFNPANPDPNGVPGYASCIISNNGKTTVNSGNFENLGEGYACYVIDNLTNGTSCSPEVIINGGRLYGYYLYAVRMFLNSNTNVNKATITGGIIEGYYGLWVQSPNNNNNKGSLTIEGGTFNSEGNGYSVFVGGSGSDTHDSSNIEIAISDGSFNGSGMKISTHSSLKSLTVSGGTFAGFVVDGDNPYVVTANNGSVTIGFKAEDDYVAKIGDEKYYTLRDAINACDSSSKTIVIEKSISTIGNIGTVMANQNVTIDLNGKTVTFTGSKAVYSTNGTTTIISSIAGGRIIHNGGASAVYAYGGTIDIGENVTIEQTSNTTAWVTKKGKININGATIISDGSVLEADTDKGLLTVNSGIIQGTGISTYSTYDSYVVLNGGSYNFNPSHYVPSGHTAIPNDSTNPTSWIVE